MYILYLPEKTAMKLSVCLFAIYANFELLRERREMEGFEKKSANSSQKSINKNIWKHQRSRLQAGYIHFCVRGNCRKVIFLDNDDKIEFLKRCNKACELYETKIEAFVIMDNHVHLQLITSQLTNFATWLLRGYSFWYNRKYSLSDKLFRTPFMSYCKFSDEWRLKSILYIIENPIKAGICTHPNDYIWSSYHKIFNDKIHRENNTIYKRINESLKIDNSFIIEHFKNIDELDAGIEKFTKTRKDLENSVLKDRRTNTSFNSRVRVATHEVIEFINKSMDIRDFHTLNKNDQKELIIKVRLNTGASYSQLSMIFNESYEYIRRIFRQLP